MNGRTAGHEPTDTRSEADPLGGLREALSLFNRAAKAACDLSEHKLQREAEDAAGRLVARIEREDFLAKQASLPFSEGIRGSEGVHGEDPQNAEVTQGFTPGSGF